MIGIDLLARFGAVALLTLLYGVERQRDGRPIGFGTFVLVSVGACALAVTAVELSTSNPLPLLSAIVTGIGFLGAGALIRSGERIGGFTSAATIWVVSVFGLVVGVGEYLLGAFLYVMLWVVLILDRALTRRGLGSHRKKLTVVAARKTGIAELRGAVFGTSPLSEESREIDLANDTQTVVFPITGTAAELDAMIERVRGRDWVRLVRIE